MRVFAALLIGAIFGLGISISGMANPAKVINFFDVAGHWDPSLAFVMGGALAVTAIGYFIVLKRPGPVLGDSFQIPTRRDIDARLLTGAAIFGVGWGLSGFCPGGAIPALGTGKIDVVIFVAAMLIGIFATRYLVSAVEKPMPANAKTQ